MSLWLEEKFLKFLSPQLDRFVQKGRHVSNFRCPLCGDSETKKTKARGYCFPKSQVLIFKCHNCDIALPFVALLRKLSPRLYDEYMLEKMRDESRPVEVAPDPPESAIIDDRRQFYVFSLDPVASLPAPLSVVHNYITDRQIPATQLHRLYATYHAQTWLKPLVGEEKSLRVVDNQPYLVMPMTLPDGTWFGAQMRLLGRKEYITFRWSHAPLKIFGLDAWDQNFPTWIMEGPLDALFVPNALAVMGSDLLGGTRVLEDMGIIHTSTPRTYVWDNEPRNRDVVRHIETAILLHHPVIIWPREYPKDINDMFVDGIDITHALDARTFRGLSAELEFSSWKM